VSSACSVYASSKIIIEDSKVSAPQSYQMPQQTFPQSMQVVQQPKIPDYAFSAKGREKVYYQLMGHANEYLDPIKKSKNDIDTYDYVEKNIKGWSEEMLSIARMMYICSQEMNQAIAQQESKNYLLSGWALIGFDQEADEARKKASSLCQTAGMLVKYATGGF
jgi:predicted ATPase